jgi:hypothetical protein
MAFAGLGLALLVAADPTDARRRAALAEAADAVADGYRAAAQPDWQWCEPVMTYDNARLCEVLVRAGVALGRPELVRMGRAMLDFYAEVTIEDGLFVPIGNHGWYARGAARARYAQQPLEAAALVDASLAALDATGDERYRGLAAAGFAWFFGRNTLGFDMIANGGCHDGLDRDGVNTNMGAESTLAYLCSAFAMLEANRSARVLRTAARTGGN